MSRSTTPELRTAHDVPSSNSSEGRILAAVEFGLASTSAAYLYQRPDRQNTPELLKEFRIIQHWPRTMAPRVPSEMSYSPSIRGCQQWGDDIDDDSRVMKWLRANLEPTDRDVTTKTTSFAKLLWEATKIERDPLDEPTPGYLIRSPDEIVGDYLYHIAEKLYEEIVVQAGRHIPEQIPTDFVFTYPPQWSRLLKQRYFQIVQSVFNTDLFPRRRDFYFVTESEANALAGVMSAEMNLGYLSQLRSGEAFIVCDASDDYAFKISQHQSATLFRIDSTERDPQGLRLTQYGYLSSGPAGWGPLFSDVRRFMSARLSEEDVAKLNATDHAYNPVGVLSPNWRRIRERWDPIAMGFDGQDNGLRYPLELPRGFGQVEDKARGILNGAFIFEPADVKRLFDSTISNLESIILSELACADAQKIRVKTIFLSGTFSANAYVNQRIRQLGFSRRIVVYNSLEDAMVSKTRGAIIHTLSLITGEPRPILRTSFHYGVASCAAYDTTKHATEDAKVNPADGAKLAVNQITWLFDKGEVLFMDDKEARKKTVILLRKFRQQDIVTGTISRVTFLACPAGKKPCTLRDPPSDGTQLVYLDYGLSDIPESQREKVEIKRRFLNKTFFKSVLTLEASMDISNIVITLRCGGTLLAERTMATA